MDFLETLPGTEASTEVTLELSRVLEDGQQPPKLQPLPEQRFRKLTETGIKDLENCRQSKASPPKNQSGC